MIQKGVGVCSSAHPEIVGSRIALSTQDRQRQLAHASTDYIIKVYRNALRRRLGCHLSVVEIGTCEIHDSQRQTFENVFLIYKIARRPRVN